MKMKVIIGCMLVAVMLTVASPVLALSIGVSPTHVELEVPGDGSATANVKIHYFDGDVQISLIDIPLHIEPEIISVEALNEPVDVELTIYGDNSLGSQVYDGYIRFIAVSGGAATGGVQVIARVTNLVEGETPVPAPPEESRPVMEVSAPEEAPAEEVTEASPEETPGGAQVVEPSQEVEKTSPAPTPSVPPAPSGASGLPILALVGIAAGTIVVVALIFALIRRRTY